MKCNSKWITQTENTQIIFITLLQHFYLFQLNLCTSIVY